MRRGGGGILHPLHNPVVYLDYELGGDGVIRLHLLLLGPEEGAHHAKGGLCSDRGRGHLGVPLAQATRLKQEIFGY